MQRGEQTMRVKHFPRLIPPTVVANEMDGPAIGAVEPELRTILRHPLKLIVDLTGRAPSAFPMGRDIRRSIMGIWGPSGPENYPVRPEDFKFAGMAVREGDRKHHRVPFGLVVSIFAHYL